MHTQNAMPCGSFVPVAVTDLVFAHNSDTDIVLASELPWEKSEEAPTDMEE